MAANGWEHASTGRPGNKIGPTIVGGSKKHGGADLGPTRAKRAWARWVSMVWVSPTRRRRLTLRGSDPKLTVEMVARLQGWDEKKWHFAGRKTSRYRQVGNAFPPPVARAIGRQIVAALNHEGEPRVHTETVPTMRSTASCGPLTTR